MRPLRVVVRGVYGQHPAEVSLSEDQHAVGEFDADGQYEAFGEAVRPRAPWRDLDHFDARVRQDCVERGRELSGPIADEEPEPRALFVEVHDEVAGLLGGPRPVGVRGHAQDVQVAVADLECEQDVEPPQLDRAVDVEEVARVSQFLLIKARRRPRLRGRPGFLAGWPARGTDREILRR